MKLSAFDRFTALFAPEWTLKRVRNRTALEAFERRGYEAASRGRRTNGWSRTIGDPNALIAKAGPDLRMHARELIRNNGWAKRGSNTIVNNVVGWGIVPRPDSESPEQNKAAAKLWKSWAGKKKCDADGLLTFYGIQSAVIRAVAADGEVLVRRRPRRPKDGLPLPFQLQVLEADYLDHSRDTENTPSGGWITQGIEFNGIGQRIGYWLFPEHPGSMRVNMSSVSASKRVPAEDIAHVFLLERPGQARGVSWFGTAIVKLKDLEEYEDADLIKQKIAACFAAFVTDPDGEAMPIGTQSSTKPQIETLQPGMVEYLTPGKEITFASPPQVNNDSTPVRALRQVAAGLGVTFEDLTGDYSQVNFSSARMSRLAHQANVRHWQANMMLPLLCDVVWSWAMEAAEMSGLLPGATEITADWTVPPLPMIEPDREGLAYQRLVRTGAMTPSEMVREQGGDPEAHWAEYAADLATLDRLKIQLDSDVRAVSQAGLTQQRTGLSGGADKAPPAPEAPARSAEDFDIDEELAPEHEAQILAFLRETTA